MKTVLALICALSLVGGIFCAAFFSLEAGMAMLGGALVAGVGYAILDRLDTLNANVAILEEIRQLLVEIRGPRAPAAPPADFDATKAVAAMLAVKRPDLP